MSEPPTRILVVGGVAGGASAAARARRLHESSEIVIFDRGPFVSFANCGLPYYVGDVIQDERKLLVATPSLFRERFNIDVKTETEVLLIDPEARRIQVHDLRTSETRWEPYDALVLAPGARAIKPPLPGIDLPGIFSLRTIPDSRRIRDAVDSASRAVVVGAGFIGLEMAENLVRRGLHVTVVEMADQVLPPLDPEMATLLSSRLRDNGVTLHLDDAVVAFESGDTSKLKVATRSGLQLDADLVVLAIGVRPENSLASDAGLDLGERGGIRVDPSMRTSAPGIWAVGDVVEVQDFVTKQWVLAPLAGPANRQGRVAAGSIVEHLGAGTSTRVHKTFRGVQSTAVCGAFGLTIAMTGASEKSLVRAGIDGFEKIYLHPGSHVGYYPGATPIHMKLLFNKEDGSILGAQAIGESGAERRIDVIATALQLGATVHDLEEVELCYAPQFGAAKDPVNIAGMIASNFLHGDLPLADWSEFDAAEAQVVDVRSPAEFEAQHADGAINLPLEQLRQRLDELPKDQEIWLICGVGQRAYYATRLLLQSGFRVRNLSGGMQTWETIQALQANESPAS